MKEYADRVALALSARDIECIHAAGNNEFADSSPE